ncbi:choice-of-anchor B family protein [Sphingobacteriales bacterium UPWRP_1]|nr:hypothetical protein B6N25_05850 [Sphingobacteriales bacterium TSM_CSS]PSJ74629.1 choice-of-anchor B family protein [Sphingobacteriales bacterium UPWRP_1]
MYRAFLFGVISLPLLANSPENSRKFEQLKNTFINPVSNPLICTYMKYIGKFLAFLLLLHVSPFLLGQSTPMDSLGNVFYPAGLSSLWGYTDAQGREYALVGAVDGLSIVDISQPDNPQELFFLPQPSGFWREIKTWQHYAYVANETDGGIFIVDLGQLPDTVYTANYTADGLIKTSHTLWIDEFGYAYISGYNNMDGTIPVNNRGVAILDLNVNPMSPTLVNTYTTQYVHDVYVRNNIMYACEIYVGQFTVVDVSDKNNLTVLAHQSTPSLFTHNCWLSDNGQFLFTTDEKNNASVTAYDITDLSDIKEVGRYKSHPGSNSMPHNVHVLNDFLVISYYRDGVRIVDAHEPDILVETEYFDTTPLAGPGSQGCWGVYQLFPSGNVIASDRQLGLFIMQPQYKRAAYLRGFALDEVSGLPLPDVSVQITGTGIAATSDFTGNFKAGLPSGGLYTLQFSKYGYETITYSDVFFTAGETLELNVTLIPEAPYNLTVQVADAQTAQGIENAFVELSHSMGVYQNQTGSAGNAIFSNLYTDIFAIYTAAWGYLPQYLGGLPVNSSNNTQNLNLERGYYDDCYADLGWTVSNSGANADGAWARVVPIGTNYADQSSNPDVDVSGDTGGVCFLTGNGNGGPESYDLDSGSSTLLSPHMDLTGYADPYLSFYRWYSAFNSTTGADTLSFYLSNGTQTVLLRTLYPDDITQHQWHLETFRVSDFLAPAANMQFVALAHAGSPESIFECGIDLFNITDGYAPGVGLPDIEATAGKMLQITPNPAGNVALLTAPTAITAVSVYNLQGQLLQTYAATGTNTLQLSVHELKPGLYPVQCQTQNGMFTGKIVVLR